MMTVTKTDTEISKLIINTLTQSQYVAAKEAGTISDTEMYVVTDDVVKQKMVSALNLFDYKWSDHLLNSKLWIRADNFQWHSNVYFSIAYNHLVADIDGKTATTETIGETTITYYLADDGHKIVLPAQESNVTAIYEATGVAWYYILDTTNQRFKLPRTKFAFTGLRDKVGNYVDPGLPNITGSIGDISQGNGNFSGAFQADSSIYPNKYNIDAANRDGISFDASRSSSIYGNSTTVQPPATQMYLYCYIGEDAMVENAGIDLEVLDNKVDIDDLVNVVTIVDTYNGSTSWYRIYSDGWCEQGGYNNTNTSAEPTVTFPQPFANINYYSSCEPLHENTLITSCAEVITTTYVTFRLSSAAWFKWYACGYIA